MTVLLTGMVVASTASAIQFPLPHAKKKTDLVYVRPPHSTEIITLTPDQLAFVNVAPVQTMSFSETKEAVGNIDFNQDRLVQVVPPYQGRVTEAYAKAGDDVRKGAPLFAIDSPDLIQAESTAISSAGVRDQTTAALDRAKQLYDIQGIALKDLQQATSDQATAEANLQAARDSLRIFGKSPAQIDAIIKSKKIDGKYVITSPISGRVTARTVALGSLVQTGMSPAPYTVADLSSKWMLANVSEGDIPAIRLGQPVDVKLLAYPDKQFKGVVSNIGAAIDPTTHRVQVRAEIQDPQRLLQPQMLANFTVHTGAPYSRPSVPSEGVVREGDGTITVWVTRDRKNFEPRTVRLGMQRGDYFEVLDGLNAGELVAGKGALFISNKRALLEN